MTLRLKLILAFIGASLLGVLVSFAVMTVMPDSVLTGLLAAALSASLTAALSHAFASGVAQALTDLHLVIHRFIKWDMDGVVPHASRADEVGDIAKALKAFQTDAIKWSEMHKSEQDSQVQLRLATQQRTEELIHQFRGSIAGILGAFADSARTMDETARALSVVASDTNERVVVVASASDEASANVQTVAATAEELAVSVGEIGGRVSAASRTRTSPPRPICWR